MIKTNKLLTAMAFSAVLIGNSFATQPVTDETEFKGNWTQSFKILDGSKVTHTPKNVSMGFMSGGTGINIDGKSYNGIALKAPVVLKTNSTVAEFTAALKASGLLK